MLGYPKPVNLANCSSCRLNQLQSVMRWQKRLSNLRRILKKNLSPSNVHSTSRTLKRTWRTSDQQLMSSSAKFQLCGRWLMNVNNFMNSLKRDSWQHAHEKDVRCSCSQKTSICDVMWQHRMNSLRIPIIQDQQVRSTFKWLFTSQLSPFALKPYLEWSTWRDLRACRSVTSFQLQQMMELVSPF